MNYFTWLATRESAAIPRILIFLFLLGGHAVKLTETTWAEEHTSTGSIWATCLVAMSLVLFYFCDFRVRKKSTTKPL